MSSHDCSFCRPNPAAIILETDDCRVIQDGFPISPGHFLIVPKAHLEDWFNAPADLQRELTRLIELTKQEIEKQYQPDGYNVGFNAGMAAGQTIGHLHIHVMPRYAGDQEDPRGGVRWVIPEKAAYWG